MNREDTVIVVAPGPSLSQEQIELIRRSGHFTIVIGDVGRVAITDADVLYHCDQRWWSYYKGVPEFMGAKFSLEQTEFYDVFKLKQSEQELGVDLRPYTVVAGNDSGYQAINLAVHCKPKKIILVGYDAKDTADGRHNIVGDHPKEVKRPCNFKRQIEALSGLVKPLEDLGILIYNCTVDSDVNCFPRKDLKDAI